MPTPQNLFRACCRGRVVRTILRNRAAEITMIFIRSFTCAGVLTLLSTAPCFPMASWFPASGQHNGGPVTHSAPGPALGVGLPALVIGGYVWYRRRSKKNK